MVDRMAEVSIIIPVKDEAENIEPLALELNQALEARPWDWECIWVDDGSEDDSPAVLSRLSGQDPRHRVLSFERNSGQSAALQAGFRAASGQVIATIDADGQNDPADLPALVELVLCGESDMVNGVRVRRNDRLLRRISSRLANSFRNLVAGRTVSDVGCSTRAFRRECVADLPLFAGMHRFLPNLVGMCGFSMIEVPVNHRPRLEGKSKYSINNRLWVGLVDTFGVLWLRKRAASYTLKPNLRTDPKD
jgi:dolichol-phosphate mannosyltransferase